MRVWMHLEYGIAMVVLAGAVAYILWSLLDTRRPLRWHGKAPRDPVTTKRRATADQQPWLILLPARWMRWGLRRLQWMGASLMILTTMAVTRNPLAAVAFGWIGFWLPEIILRDVAWARWQALDRAAYSTLFSIRFYVAQGTAVLEAWRDVLPYASPAFQRWIEPCLMAEVDQSTAPGHAGAFERVLKDQAQAIRHSELSITSDILAAQRTHGGALRSLERLLRLWGKRIELDADRRGNLSGFVWLGRASLAVGIALFWILSLADATVRVHMHTLVGGGVTGASALLLALGTTAYYRQNRLAEQF